MEIKHNIQTGTIEFVTYIGGDGYTAPIVLKSDGTTQNYLYLQRDYQGSIVAVSDATGQVLEKRLFDAWGNVLVQDGAGNVLNGLILLDRGYTGHEHLQSVGLIHMNGRLYDPKLHRFLQPDNYVQDPSNTQNYNRYGYVLNNPLKYTDPSGELSFKSIGRWFKRNLSDIVAGAAIVAGVAIVIASGGTLTPLAATLIGSGVAHFGVAYAEYTRTGNWAEASNNAGFNFSYTHTTDWGYNNKDKQNGVNQNAPVVKPKTDSNNSAGNSNSGSLPCNGDCDGWMGTEYIGPTSVSTFLRKQNPVDMVDLAAKYHDAGYIYKRADGISGALFNLSVQEYDAQLYVSSQIAFDGYFWGDIDPVTRRPISLQTASRAFAVKTAFGAIAGYKTVFKGILDAYNNTKFFSNNLNIILINFFIV